MLKFAPAAALVACLATSAHARPLPPAPAALASKVALELVTSDTHEATGIVAAPEPKGRLFVIEKAGKIRILRGAALDAVPFLDITAKVGLDPRENGEMGLLGLAFHPQFQKNGRFYIDYTDLRGDTRVVEFHVDAQNPNRADLKSQRLLLQIDQPFRNHNAGHIVFGPDGKLYVLMGDGGSANDPFNNAQNDASLLGKALRLDVEDPNPLPEIWAKGMRNPWRYSFDRKTGDLYIADVGQNLFEYVHVLGNKELAGPLNLGWNVMEGLHCFDRSGRFNKAGQLESKERVTCDPTRFRPAVIEYPHSEGCSISGGSVYRGKALPELDGVYFYADYCTALLRSFRWKAGAAGKPGTATEEWDWKPALDPESKLAKLAAFGEDQDGELYLVTHEGPIFKFVRAGKKERSP